MDRPALDRQAADHRHVPFDVQIGLEVRHADRRLARIGGGQRPIDLGVQPCRAPDQTQAYDRFAIDGQLDALVLLLAAVRIDSRIRIEKGAGQGRAEDAQRAAI